jgi:EAL domain-containing protein (putative c-di-GMP-specific phosphodiesterase class I)
MSLEQLDFPDLVEAMCIDAGVPTHQVVIELTEGATQPLINLMDTMTRFRIKGFRLAIDDFGTGYSSMMQLHQLPFTEVKIDRSFVIDATRAADSRLIVKTIIDLAHGLGMVVTAEGIEEPQQIDLLRELGCDLAQGFLISPPMDADEIAPWKKRFEAGWKEALRSGDLELWGNVEADSLR